MIQSEGFPNSYPAHANNSWEIVVAKGFLIKFQITDIAITGETGQCKEDKLIISDKYSTLGEPRLHLLLFYIQNTDLFFCYFCIMQSLFVGPRLSLCSLNSNLDATATQQTVNIHRFIIQPVSMKEDFGLFLLHVARLTTLALYEYHSTRPPALKLSIRIFFAQSPANYKLHLIIIHFTGCSQADTALSIAELSRTKALRYRSTRSL